MPLGARWLPGRRELAKLVLLAAAVPLASGCGLLGGLSGSRLVSPASMTVTSPEFRTDVPLPPQYTCAGAALSPPLYWSSALSQQPKSFAVVVDDGEAPITPYIYWIVFDISPNTTDIAQNRLPTGARQAQNSAGTARYDAPCPGNKDGAYIQIYCVCAERVTEAARWRWPASDLVSDSQARDRGRPAHGEGGIVAGGRDSSRTVTAGRQTG